MGFSTLLCVLFTLVLCARLAAAHLNLYINVTEARRLLGIDGEVFLVRNGIVNNYALKFNYSLGADLQDIYFTWQSLRLAPSEQDIFYKVDMNVSNTLVLPKLSISIPTEGVVPRKLSWFRVRFPCTGKLEGNVQVHITLSFSIFSMTNLTVVHIRRNKFCPLGLQDVQLKHDSVGYKEGNTSLTHSIDSKVNPLETTSTNLFYIAVGCACFLILLIALIVGVYYIRSQKPVGTVHMSDTSSSHGLTRQTYLKSDKSNSSVAGYQNVHGGYNPVNQLKKEDVLAMVENIHIQRKRLTLGDVIMEGTFGKVYSGTIVGDGSPDVDNSQNVYVKTVTEQAKDDQLEKMIMEGSLMKGFMHMNVNPILYVCFESNKHPMLVYMSTSEGNLKKFLQRCKMSDMTSRYSLNTQQLVYMAIQVIRGLQYIHRKRIVHKDVATRNCIIDSTLTIKMTDNALSRDLFPSDYHCLGDNENRPIKWLSLEALLNRKFSFASDIWAFGVLLWELLTLGQQPYSDIDPFEMAAYLQDGYRISQPINCPDELFAVMACCWAAAPEERPKFAQLLVCLQDFYRALGCFI